MAVKPTVDPKWSTANNPANNIEPTLSLKNGGVPAGGVWGREFLNWQFYAISQWIDWVRSSALDRDNNLSDLTNAATARTNLGLGTASTRNVATTTQAIAGTAGVLPDAEQVRRNHVAQVATIADLRGLEPVFDGQQVSVKSYHPGIYGGGGIFVWDATRSKAEHNGGTIIDPSKSFPADWSDAGQQTSWFTANVSGSGCFLRKYDVAEIRHFGAIGDGVSDDTRPFDALVANVSSKGSTGLISEGVFSVGFTGNKDFSGRPNFSIKGVSRESSILKNRTPTNNFIYWSELEGFTLSDLTLSGDYHISADSNTGSGGLLVFKNGNNISVFNVDLLDFRRTAIMSFNDHNSTGLIYSGLDIRCVRAIGNPLFVNNLGPSAIVVADTHYVNIEKCYIENIGQYGYELKNSCKYSRIADCTAVMAYKGIYFGGDAEGSTEYVTDTAVSNIVLKDCRLPIAMGNTRRITISDVYSDTVDAGPPDRATIAITNSEGVRATGLVISNRKFYAVDVRGLSKDIYVEYSLIDGDYRSDSAHLNDTIENVKVVATSKNHNLPAFNRLRVRGISTVVDVQAGLQYGDKLETSPEYSIGLKKDRPNYLSSVAGFAFYGPAANMHFTGDTDRQWIHLGTSENYSLHGFRNDYSQSTMRMFVTDPATSSRTYVALTNNSLRPDVLPPQHSLGTATYRWTELFAVNGTINTSDEREKQQITHISDAVLRAWAKVDYVQYKFNDAVAKKGDGARWHFGLVAQRVKEAFESEGLDAFEYGILCYDEWDEEPEELDEEGNVVSGYRAAGNRYGIRYEEALALECAYLRSRLG